MFGCFGTASALDQDVEHDAVAPCSASIRALAELESSLISERVTAGIKAAEARGRHLGRPPIAARVIEIEGLAASASAKFRGRSPAKASRRVVGEITKRVRARLSPP